MTQGKMIVAEYAKKFKHLTYFYNFPINEEWVCNKFKNSFKSATKNVVIHLFIKEFLTLIEKAQIIEKLKAEDKVHKTPIGGSSRSKPNHEEKKKPYSRS